MSFDKRDVEAFIKWWEDMLALRETDPEGMKKLEKEISGDRRAFAAIAWNAGRHYGIKTGQDGMATRIEREFRAKWKWNGNADLVFSWQNFKDAIKKASESLGSGNRTLKAKSGMEDLSATHPTNPKPEKPCGCCDVSKCEEHSYRVPPEKCHDCGVPLNKHGIHDVGSLKDVAKLKKCGIMKPKRKRKK